MQKELTADRAIKNLSAYIAEQRLITGAWSRTEDGKELGCLLHAIGNSEFNITDPSQCPASLMPAWLANWVPGAFDGAGQSEAYKVAALFRDFLEKTKGFDEPQWEKLRIFFLCSQIEFSIEQSKKVCEGTEYWPTVEGACVGMVAALKSGDAEQIKAAESAARSAESAAWSAESAAESAARSAESAAESARSAARSAESAAWSAESAAESAARSAESAAWSAARSAAESAARSAESAAESARSARSAAYVGQFKKLLELARGI